MAKPPITLTQKEFDKKIGEARTEGYEIGLREGKSKIYGYQSQQAMKAVKLIDSLVEFFDERYQQHEEDY